MSEQQCPTCGGAVEVWDKTETSGTKRYVPVLQAQVERLKEERDRQLAAAVEAGEALSRSQDWILAGFPGRVDYEKADEAIKAWIRLVADIPAAGERVEKLVRLLREAANSHHNAHPEVTGWTLEKCQNGLCMERAAALREWEGK